MKEPQHVAITLFKDNTYELLRNGLFKLIGNMKQGDAYDLILEGKRNIRVRFDYHGNYVIDGLTGSLTTQICAGTPSRRVAVNYITTGFIYCFNDSSTRHIVYDPTNVLDEDFQVITQDKQKPDRVEMNLASDFLLTHYPNKGTTK